MHISVAPLAGAWIEIEQSLEDLNGNAVAPLAGAWIEILLALLFSNDDMVAPLAGAWIEIPDALKLAITETGSLPSRERGLKL